MSSVNITSFFYEAEPMDYSSSAAEIGDNAGADTWQAACDDSNAYMMLSTIDMREDFRAWLKPFGAWTEEQIQAFTKIELNALFIQFVSSEMRECNLGRESSSEDWTRYQVRAEKGLVPSSIYRDEETGSVYFSLDH
jgi:hypothetical protein